MGILWVSGYSRFGSNIFLYTVASLARPDASCIKLLVLGTLLGRSNDAQYNSAAFSRPSGTTTPATAPAPPRRPSGIPSRIRALHLKDAFVLILGALESSRLRPNHLISISFKSQSIKLPSRISTYCIEYIEAPDLPVHNENVNDRTDRRRRRAVKRFRHNKIHIQFIYTEDNFSHFLLTDAAR